MGIEKEYLLLNKNIKVAKFKIDRILQAPVIEERYSIVPSWINDLSTFIINRRAPKSRENISELLKISGCDTIEGFLDITHALSLIDTFWVKRANSKLQWEDVSLYTHKFNEVIAKTAFEGGLHGQNFSTTSPEYGTNGTFAKCWIRENGTIKLLKRGSSGARNAGLEPYSEFYAGQLIEKITDNFVKYDLRSTGGRMCSVCDIFTSEEYGFIPYAAIETGNSSVQSVIRVTSDLGFGKEIKDMFIADALILNEDRHKNNFGFIVDNKNQKIVGFAPLFDHNISLLPYAEQEDFKKGEYVKSKGPKIGDSWVRSAAYCLDGKTRKKLINLHGFEFEKHKKYNLPDWRLRHLEKIINENVKKILSY